MTERKSPRAHKAAGTFEKISLAADVSKDSTTTPYFQSSRIEHRAFLGAISERVVAKLARRCQISRPHAIALAALLCEETD